MIYNLSLDDLLPSFRNLQPFHWLLRQHPKLKITIFMPVNSRDLGAGKNDIRKHPAWCEKVRKLPKENFEFSFHGWEHHYPGGGKKPEFLGLNAAQAETLLLECEAAFWQMGIPYVKGFRPPRWRISKGTARALEKLNYLYLSDSPRYRVENGPIGIPRVYANSDIRWGVKTADIEPYLDSGLLLDREKYCIHRGHVVARVGNHLKPGNVKRIDTKIKSFGGKVEFKFLSEIARSLP